MSEAGRRAFEAYSNAVKGRTYDGKRIPKWELLSDSVRAGWEAAAAPVARLERHVASLARRVSTRFEECERLRAQLVEAGLEPCVPGPRLDVEIEEDHDPVDTPTESEWQVTEREQRCACLGIPGCYCRP